MDIAAFSVGMSQFKLAQAVSLSVAKISMDTAKTQANDMLKILENSVTPHKGGNIDIKL